MNSFLVQEQEIVDEALALIDQRFASINGEQILSAASAKRYASLKLSAQVREVFSVLLLTRQFGVIRYVELFYGTVNACPVYPREVVRSCIEHNAGAVIFFHNHPGGGVEPSECDKKITKCLVDALDYIDVKVNDHIIVAGTSCYSFAENGILPMVGSAV